MSTVEKLRCVQCKSATTTAVCQSEKNKGREYYQCENKDCDQRFNGFVGDKPFRSWAGRKQGDVLRTLEEVSEKIRQMQREASRNTERIIFCVKELMQSKNPQEAEDVYDTDDNIPLTPPKLYRQKAELLPPGAPLKRAASRAGLDCSQEGDAKAQRTKK